jgi:hypothetical protein
VWPTGAKEVSAVAMKRMAWLVVPYQPTSVVSSGVVISSLSVESAVIGRVSVPEVLSESTVSVLS